MDLERSQVEHIALLARIGLTDEEVELFREQLSHILEQFAVLQELDTTGVLPAGHAGEPPGLAGVMRDDSPEDSLDHEDVMRNAPRREGEFFRVKVVLEE
ncbi:MAG: Asp-tRNA(Asn)/Glu-tRNA(Gln) amidotransferase subunit GatC [Chloroflexi bacterium]|nr:Asp-tRNA(Asn)/Glu-tRNA(Gln) amidotransferase subunit GatC [Chloroflexota bacterium]